jgi:uncharacterized protein with NRDE domain
MCLIIVAHRVSERFPLVIAANRDEDYLRPSLRPHWWSDAPDVFGGRDALHGGSWLAMRKGGRWAAVTNRRGAVKQPDSRSRGKLVSEFVRGDDQPLAYAQAIDASQYAGFHLLVGDGAIVSDGRELAPGIHGVSNGPPDAMRVQRGIDAMRDVLNLEYGGHAAALEVLRFLNQRSLFVSGERYGTRSSTAIVVEGVTAALQVVFAEQAWLPLGAPDGEPQIRNLEDRQDCLSIEPGTL